VPMDIVVTEERVVRVVR